MRKLSIALNLLLTILVIVFIIDIITNIITCLFNLGIMAESLVDAVLVILLAYPALYIFIFRPMSDEVAKHQKAAKELRRLAAIVESSDDAIISKTLDGEIVTWNHGAEKVYGYTQAEAIGKPISIVVPPEKKDETTDILKKIARGEPFEYFETTRIRKDGTTIYVSLTISPIYDESGAITGASTISRDISERKRIEKVKDEFIGTVSHELRTPLSITKEGICLILDKIPGAINEEQVRILTISKNNIDRLARIINSLLDISRAESGKIKARHEAFDIVSVVRQAMVIFEPKIKEKRLALRSELPKNSIIIHGDPDSITQVLTNLIGNSYKFTDRGSIDISIKETAENVEISVADTGIGIARENMMKLFGKFQQFGRMRGPGEKGTGLGLAIAKGIVTAHNGKIWAESEFGKGTRMTFTLPKKA
ncbi:MAG: PAS domain S-box protein [Candidatus Omnitrophota bacterium]